MRATHVPVLAHIDTTITPVIKACASITELTKDDFCADIQGNYIV